MADKKKADTVKVTKVKPRPGSSLTIRYTDRAMDPKKRGYYETR